MSNKYEEDLLKQQVLKIMNEKKAEKDGSRRQRSLLPEKRKTIRH